MDTSYRKTFGTNQLGVTEEGGRIILTYARSRTYLAYSGMLGLTFVICFIKFLSTSWQQAGHLLHVEFRRSCLNDKDTKYLTLHYITCTVAASHLCVSGTPSDTPPRLSSIHLPACDGRWCIQLRNWDGAAGISELSDPQLAGWAFSWLTG